MDDDLNKREHFVFQHPKDSITNYYRHYKESPANGNTILIVGPFLNSMDFVNVFIVLKSYYYKEPYLVIYDYPHMFRNPDTLADMISRAFNWALRKTGVEVVLEPWGTKGERIQWCRDYIDSYHHETKMIDGANLIRKGYEDALELDKKEAEAAGMPVGSRKSDDIRVYIKSGYDKNRVIEFLRLAVKGMTAAREIAMPFRFLLDREITAKIPYKAVIKAFPELEGLIKERRYNNWTNPYSTSYDGDDRYETMNGLIEMIL
jgi:hypothetical protein